MSSTPSTNERRSGTARRWFLVLVGALSLNALLLGLAFGLSGERTVASPAVPPQEQVASNAAVATQEAAVKPATIEPQSVQQSAAAPIEPAAGGQANSAERMPLAAESAVEPLASSPKEPADETAISTDPSESVASETCPPPSAPAAVDTPSAAADTAPAMPAEPVVETTPAARSLPADALLVINGPHTGGEVQFVVDSQLHSLQPGEYLQLPAEALRTVGFHRGGDFGESQHQVQQGAYVFRVTDAGWQLAAIPASTAAVLLGECRAVEGK